MSVPVRQERAWTLADFPRGLQGRAAGEVDRARREEAAGAVWREVS